MSGAILIVAARPLTGKGMPTAPTPVSASITLVLDRYCQATGNTMRGLSLSAGLSPATIREWTRGVAPRCDSLEKIVDVLGRPMSAFFSDCEALVTGRPPRPLEVIALECSPSRSWKEAVSQAARCLRVDAFEGGLLKYGGRWVALVPTDAGCRLDLVTGADKALAELDKLLRFAAR
jgi:transcriptional regulator with XRE-family HTH domain